MCRSCRLSGARWAVCANENDPRGKLGPIAARDAGESDQSKAAVIEGIIVPVSNKMLVEKRNCDLG